MDKPKTREAWLEAMTKALRPKFKAAGYPIPKRVAVSCGWPMDGARRKQAVIGECWNVSASDAGHHEIFISPTVADSVAAGAVLVHELIHSTLPEDVHHDGPYKIAHRALGLIDKPTTCVPGVALKAELVALVAKLGAYPHSRIKPGIRRTKVQTTRLLKAECPDCGYVIRVTAKWAAVGLPTCPCGGEMAAA